MPVNLIVGDCHNVSFFSVMWISPTNSDTDYYQYQLTTEAEIFYEANTTDTFANITDVPYNDTNITFSITAHNCAGISDEVSHLIQLQGTRIL